MDKILKDALIREVGSAYKSLMSKSKSPQEYCEKEKRYYDSIIKLSRSLKVPRAQIWVNDKGDVANILNRTVVDDNYLFRIHKTLEKQYAKAILNLMDGNNTRRLRKKDWLEAQMNFVKDEILRRHDELSKG